MSAPASNFSWRQLLITNTLIGMLGPVFVLAFNRSFTVRQLWNSFAIGMMYSHCIGSAAHLSLLLIWPRLAQMRPWRRWAMIALVLSAACALGVFIGVTVLSFIGFYRWALFTAIYPSVFRGALLITFLFGGGALMFDSLRRQLERSNLELRAKEAERERALKLATEARLASLESRIHPHFLFNALNSIASLIREDPQRAERLIERMSALLRFSLESTERGVVSLDEELKIVADYLEIESARFGSRLRHRIDVAPELRACEVPALSIQTLVENSIKHVLAKRVEGVTIEISAVLEEGLLRVRVSDDGPGFSADAVAPGHGLDNLRARLETLYGGDAGLSIGSGAGADISLTVPAAVAALSRK